MTDIKNFRPISNICSLAKVFELCLLQKLEKIDNDVLFGEFQHGFRKQHSTTSAMVELTEALGTAKDEGKHVLVYSADMTAAFDVLQKEKLVSKMTQKGIPKYLIRIIHNYLSDRFGFVQFGLSKSRLHEIRAGCIQGSVLGPILFNILISDLSDVISPSETVAYADDAYIIVTGNSHADLENNLNSTLARHLDWLKNTGMICSISKTEIMVLGNQIIQINIDGSDIKSQSHLKVLGITFDSNLKWDMHVENTVNKCRSLLYSLRYLRRHLNVKDLSKIVKAQIVSILSYGSPAWYHRLNYHLRLKIRSTYYHIIRVLVRDFQFELNRKGLLRAIGMEDLDTILQKRSSCFIFKIINCLEPTNLTHIFISKSYSNERTPEKITFFDTSRTRIGKACLSNNLVKIVAGWNFPWLGTSITEFKSHLAAQFLDAV